MFNERYISTPISQVLAYRFKCGVSAEHPHPTLSVAKDGPGAKPCVDFAAIEKFPKVRALVESKWLNDAGVRAEALVWDLIRLEMVAHAENAEAFFVLAGERERMREVFEGVRYYWQNAKGAEGPIFDRIHRTSVAINKIDGKYTAKLHPYFQKYPTGSFPSEIHLSQPYSYPYGKTTLDMNDEARQPKSKTSEPKNGGGEPKYQVWVWEVKSEGVRRFQPLGDQ